MNRITFSHTTVKHLEQELQKAYARGDARLVRRITVLLASNRQKELSRIARTWGIA